MRSDQGALPIIEIVALALLITMATTTLVSLPDAPSANRAQAEMESRMREQVQAALNALQGMPVPRDEFGGDYLSYLLALGLANNTEPLEDALRQVLPPTAIYNVYIRMGSEERLILRQGSPPGAAVSGVVTSNARWRPVYAFPDVDVIIATPGGVTNFPIGMLAAPLWDGGSAWPIGAELEATVSGKQAWTPGRASSPFFGTPTVPYNLTAAAVTYGRTGPSVMLSMECKKTVGGPTDTKGLCSAAVADPSALGIARLPGKGGRTFLNVTVSNHDTTLPVPLPLPANTVLYVEAPPGVTLKVNRSDDWSGVKIQEGPRQPARVEARMKDPLPAGQSRNISLEVTLNDNRYSFYPISARLLGNTTAQTVLSLQPPETGLPSVSPGEIRQVVLTVPRPFAGTDVPFRVSVTNPLGVSSIDSITVRSDSAIFSGVSVHAGTDCTLGVCPIPTLSGDGKTITMNPAVSVGGGTNPRFTNIWFRASMAAAAPLGAGSTPLPELRMSTSPYTGPWSGFSTGRGIHLQLEPPATTSYAGITNEEGKPIAITDETVPVEASSSFRQRTSRERFEVVPVQALTPDDYDALLGIRDALQAVQIAITPNPGKPAETITFDIDATHMLTWLSEFGSVTTMDTQVDILPPWGEGNVTTFTKTTAIGAVSRRLNDLDSIDFGADGSHEVLVAGDDGVVYALDGSSGGLTAPSTFSFGGGNVSRVVGDPGNLGVAAAGIQAGMIQARQLSDSFAQLGTASQTGVAIRHMDMRDITGSSAAESLMVGEKTAGGLVYRYILFEGGTGTKRVDFERGSNGHVAALAKLQGNTPGIYVDKSVSGNVYNEVTVPHDVFEWLDGAAQVVSTSTGIVTCTGGLVAYDLSPNWVWEMCPYGLPRSVDAVDLTGDGIDDIIMGTDTGHVVAYDGSKPAPEFSISEAIDVWGPATAIAVGDPHHWYSGTGLGRFYWNYGQGVAPQYVGLRAPTLVGMEDMDAPGNTTAYLSGANGVIGKLSGNEAANQHGVQTWQQLGPAVVAGTNLNVASLGSIGVPSATSIDLSQFDLGGVAAVNDTKVWIVGRGKAPLATNDGILVQINGNAISATVLDCVDPCELHEVALTHDDKILAVGARGRVFLASEGHSGEYSGGQAATTSERLWVNVTYTGPAGGRDVYAVTTAWTPASMSWLEQLKFDGANPAWKVQTPCTTYVDSVPPVCLTPAPPLTPGGGVASSQKVNATAYYDGTAGVADKTFSGTLELGPWWDATGTTKVAPPASGYVNTTIHFADGTALLLSTNLATNGVTLVSVPKIIEYSDSNFAAGCDGAGTTYGAATCKTFEAVAVSGDGTTLIGGDRVLMHAPTPTGPFAKKNYPDPTGGSAVVRDVVFTSLTHAAMAAEKTVLISNDAGQTWDDMPIDLGVMESQTGTTLSLKKVAAVEPGVAIAAGGTTNPQYVLAGGYAVNGTASLKGLHFDGTTPVHKVRLEPSPAWSLAISPYGTLTVQVLDAGSWKTMPKNPNALDWETTVNALTDVKMRVWVNSSVGAGQAALLKDLRIKQYDSSGGLLATKVVNLGSSSDRAAHYDATNSTRVVWDAKNASLTADTTPPLWISRLLRAESFDATAGNEDGDVRFTQYNQLTSGNFVVARLEQPDVPLGSTTHYLTLLSSAGGLTQPGYPISAVATRVAVDTGRDSVFWAREDFSHVRWERRSTTGAVSCEGEIADMNLGDAISLVRGAGEYEVVAYTPKTGTVSRVAAFSCGLPVWETSPTSTLRHLFSWKVPTWLPGGRYIAVASFSWPMPGDVINRANLATTGRTMETFQITVNDRIARPPPMDVLVVAWDATWT